MLKDNFHFPIYPRNARNILKLGREKRGLLLLCCFEIFFPRNAKVLTYKLRVFSNETRTNSKLFLVFFLGHTHTDGHKQEEKSLNDTAAMFNDVVVVILSGLNQRPLNSLKWPPRSSGHYIGLSDWHSLNFQWFTTSRGLNRSFSELCHSNNKTKNKNNY